LPWVVKNLGETDKDTFTQITDAISDEIKNKNIADVVIVIGAKIADKVLFSASAGNTAVKTYGIHCGELVKLAAQRSGGGGGGSPIRAQAGGKDPSKLGEALDAVTAVISSKAGSAK
jgi:alanyl-tRNA synthetase